MSGPLLATAWAIFQGLLIEALPFLLIGVALATVARRIDRRGGWMQRLPDHPLLGPLSGAAMGFALPACECGNVPVARRLLGSGAPLGTALGFLFAAPVLNPIVLASTWAAFPDQPWLLLARPLGAVLIALALALLLQNLPEAELLEAALLEERRLSQPLSQVSLLERRSGVIGVGAGPGALPLTPPTAPAISTDWGTLLAHGSREFLDLSLLLVIGCAIAALVQTLIPREWLLLVGQAPTLSILALMLLAVLVSVCSSVDAFLALGFAAQVTPGALLAFLLLGPVIDLKLIGLFSLLFRPRGLLLTVVGASLAVLLICQWVNLLLR
ncbi:MAG: permease [Prochlorococcaceae cyanobacterium]